MKKCMLNCCGGLVIAFSLFIPKAFAADPAPSGLPAMLDEALKNNPQLQAERERVRAARLRVPQASALPDPKAGYTVMGPMLETRLGPQKDVYEFEQMVPFPGKLIEKRRLARSEMEAAEARMQQVEREVIVKVTDVYYDLYAVNANLALTQKVYDLLKKFENIAQARYASQKGEQRDVAKAQTEVSETLKQILLLRQQKETAEAYLTALLNSSAMALLPEDGRADAPWRVPHLNLSLDELVSLAHQNRPELMGARARLEMDRHASVLAQYDNAPDISIGFQYIRIGQGDTSDPDDGRDAWMIPFKVTLPLWQNRIGSAIEEARRNLKAGESRLKEEENLTDYEVKSAYYKFTAAQQVLDLYQNALIPQAELAFNSDQAGYEAGRTDILNFIDSERVYLDSQVAYYQSLAEAAKSFAALERAVGIDLKDFMKSPEGGSR